MCSFCGMHVYSLVMHSIPINYIVLYIFHFDFIMCFQFIVQEVSSVKMSHHTLSHRESVVLESSPLRRKSVLNLSNSDASLRQVRGKMNMFSR